MSIRKTATRIGLLAAAVTVITGGLSMTADASSAAATLRYGSHGWGVKCVQESVNNWAARNGNDRPLAVDGRFGNGTRSWVERFQSASGIPVDGVVGKQTGNSVLANLQGDSTWRHDCYYYVPSTHG
ncbi:peptidoglycan-binding domain-containing protein [Streptomyces sp. NPDC046759]|uniref:peptidoglycan-binding domain-containing protein n=1 Tax=Streptomyces sp. NPDC046759 TaxID=3155019 RepID=UPI00340559F6